MSKLLLTSILFALLFTPLARASGGSDTIVIMPFENVSGRAEYNWIGESFSASLADLLDKPGLVVIRSDERNVAYKQEGLPPTAILTRATMIKIAERAGANLVVLGTYRINDERDKGNSAAPQPQEGEQAAAQKVSTAQAQEAAIERTISITARFVDIREGRLLGEFNIGGDLYKLQEFQGALAYEVLSKRNPALPFSANEIKSQATQAPIGAFENFIKGTLTKDRKAQMDFLNRAIKEFNDKAQARYIPAIFELGRLHYEAGEYKEAVDLLALIGEREPRYDEAQFYLGVAQTALGQTDQALASQQNLAAILPLYEVYNNIGALLLRKNRVAEAVNHLKPAHDVAPRDTDTLFNLGYAYYLSKDYAKAAGALRQQLERRPEDGEAQYVLSKALLALGDKDGATEAANQAKRLLSSYAQWETKGAPVLARLKSGFSKANYYRFKRDKDERVNADNGNSGDLTQAEQLLERARTAFFAGRDDETFAAIEKLLQIAPQSYEGHMLMARVYERRGDFEKSLTALKAALFWNPRLVAAHVLGGRIAVLKNDCANARAALNKALQINPTDQDALALQRLVEQKCA